MYFLHERRLAGFGFNGDPNTVNKGVCVGARLIQQQCVDRKLLFESGNRFRMLAEGLDHEGHVTRQRLTVDKPPHRRLASVCVDV